MKKRILSGLISLAMAAAFIPAAYAQTTEFEYSWNFNDTSVAPDNNGKTDFNWNNPNPKGTPAVSAIAGPSGAADDYAFGYVPALFANATGGDRNLHKYANGVSFLSETLAAEPIQDTSFVASVDFMYRNTDMIAYILSPRLQNETDLFPLAIKLDKDGALSCTSQSKPYVHSTGSSPKTTTYSSAEIGKVAPNEWYNVAVKYTVSSTEGMTADVYLNGELKAQGLTHNNNNGIAGFVSISSPESNSVLAGKVRTAGRNEQIYLDNLYIGTDLSKVSYDFAISDVTNQFMDELTVHFNKDLDAAITTDDIWVTTTDGAQAAAAKSVTAADSRTVKLKLDTALSAYTKYTVTYFDGENIISRDFTPAIALFYDFNTEEKTYQPFSPNTNNSRSIIKVHEEGRYKTDSNDYDMTFVTHVGTQNDAPYGTIDKNKNGYNIYTTPNGAAVKTGRLNVSFDFKYDSEYMCGWLIAPRVNGSIPNQVRFEDNRLYCGGTNDLGVELKKDTWYNVTAIYDWYDGGVITKIYLDGKRVGTDYLNTYTGGFNTVSTLINAKTPAEYVGQRADSKETRNEYFHMDNVYISVDKDYHTSGFQTRFEDDKAVISSGIFNKAGTAFVALYEADTLKAVKLADFALDKLNVQKLSAEFDEYAEGDTIKLICLEDIKTLKPLNIAAEK